MIFYKARAMPEIWENKKRRGERAENLEKDERFHAKRGRKRARKEERGEEGGSDPNSHSRRFFHCFKLSLTD